MRDDTRISTTSYGHRHAHVYKHRMASIVCAWMCHISHRRFAESPHRQHIQAVEEVCSGRQHGETRMSLKALVRWGSDRTGLCDWAGSMAWAVCLSACVQKYLVLTPSRVFSVMKLAISDLTEFVIKLLQSHAHTGIPRNSDDPTPPPHEGRKVSRHRNHH